MPFLLRYTCGASAFARVCTSTRTTPHPHPRASCAILALFLCRFMWFLLCPSLCITPCVPCVRGLSAVLHAFPNAYPMPSFLHRSRAVCEFPHASSCVDLTCVTGSFPPACAFYVGYFPLPCAFMYYTVCCAVRSQCIS